MGTTRFRHKETGSEVEAWKFDGTDDTAGEIATIVNSRGGNMTWVPKGHFDYDLHNAYGCLTVHGEEESVRPYFWVLDVQPEGPHVFYTIWGDDFTELYEPVNAGV